MDFSKIKPAVEEITLSDSQKEDILNACRGKKRRFNYKPVAAVAAAAAIVIVLASPGFLFRAGAPADSAAQESADDIYYNYFADIDPGDAFVNNSSSTAEAPLFAAEGFTDIYAIIPHEFSSLADPAEYEEWKSTLSAEGGMAMMQFVEHFGIAREDFDSANSAYAARTAYDDAYTFDANIIYSFDKDLVDSCYRK